MTKKLYTPENCKLVGEWLARALGECKATSVGEYLSDPNLPWDSSMLTPELIREALAGDGVSVLQGYRHRSGYLDLTWKCNGERIYLRQPWSFRNDPTARHAIFAATLEYLEGKK